MFVAIAYFSRRLPPAQFGVFFLFFALEGLASIPADMGISSALEKRLSEGEAKAGMLGSALVIKCSLIAVVTVCLLVSQGYVNAYLGMDVTILLVFAVVLRELSLFYIHAVRGNHRVGVTAPIEFARRLTWVSIGVILVAAGFGVRGLLWSLVAGSGVTFGIAYLTCTVSIGQPRLDHVRSLVAFSKYDVISALGGRVYQWMDTAIIGLFLAHQFVSAYEVAWQVTLLVLLISKPIALTLFPHISRLQADASTDQIGATISNALGFATFASVPAIVGATIYAPAILHYLFGSEYVIAAMVLVVLMVEKLFQSLNDVISIAVRAIDRPDLAAKATVASVGVNLILSPILLLMVGFIGVAVATTFSWLLNTLLHIHYLSQHVPLNIPYRLIGWYVVASVGMGVVLVGVKTVVPITGVVVLFFEVGLGGVIYAAFAVTIPAIRNRIIVPGLQAFGVGSGQ
ncbi:putative transport protein [Halococcus thailandensis JCM 13552]|uniref:Putative transport protein n=2 Tax=Halococcus thailandensis TaxID=335952 RepID=M0NF63_9EURY|nr:putative transport protein [Halococcus thailandensis JCM 13552]